MFFDVLHDEKVVDHEEEVYKMLNFFYQRGFPRFVDFEKNIADNLMKIYEMEKNNE